MTVDISESIEDRVARWGMEVDGADFLSISEKIEYLADKRFAGYQPTAGPHPDFRLRLRDWLNHLTEEDQKILFQLIPYIFYIDHTDFEALYRAAFKGAIARWLIEQQSISLENAAFSDGLSEGISKTWFCPITDSMKIADFYHMNQINGRDYRPDWRSIRKFGDIDSVISYIESEGIERLVLLEDFVGSGSQMHKTVQFAASRLSPLPILLAPLIICPSGANLARQIEQQHGHLTFAPVLTLQEDAFICELPQLGENHLFPEVRELIERTYTMVSGGHAPDDRVEPYGPYGWNIDQPRYGALVVTYSNCPNNTIPAIHHKSANWSALFPRSVRL